MDRRFTRGSRSQFALREPYALTQCLQSGREGSRYESGLYGIRKYNNVHLMGNRMQLQYRQAFFPVLEAVILDD